MAGELLRKYQLKWFDEGVQEGAQEKSLAVAKALLENGVSYEIILKSTGLSAEELQELQSEVYA